MIPRRTAIPRIQPPVLSSGVTVGSTEICANAAVAGRKSTRSAPSVAALSHLMRRDARIPRPPTATREPEMGFEPMTYHLRGGCFATGLLRRTEQDINDTVRPSDDGCVLDRSLPARASRASRAIASDP